MEIRHETSEVSFICWFIISACQNAKWFWHLVFALDV
jgi:hypothetical protein